MARTHLVQERRAATSCGGPRAWGLAPIFCLTLLFPGVSWATKVTPPVDLAIAGDASTLVLGGTATVTLTVTPRVDVALGRVQFQSSSGDVEIVGAGEIDLGAVKAGTHYPVSVPVRIAGQGKAEVRGWFYAFDDRNGLQFGRSRALYFVISSTGVLAGDTSFIDLELAQAKRLREAKSLNGEQYRARIHNLMGHQGIESIKFEKTGSVDNASAGNKATFRLDGYINWTDPTGATHRAPYTRVEIYEHNASGDELITTAETSLGGYYKADIDNADPEGGGRDIFIRALSMNNDRARVMNATTGDTYFIQSSVAPDIADSAFLHIDLTANNTDTPDRAFSAHHALGVLVDATGYYLGGSLPRIDVDFPTTMSTSNYSGAVLHVLMDDWIDWDVIDHEYGHYFMHERNIESNPGGVHALNENLGERVGKDAGIRQAWGEGFPTYFGVSSQQVMGLDRLGMLNVADSRYQDTIDSTIDYDLEASSPGATFLGEDNEASVQRILWDLYDGDADGQDRVKLRYANVYNAAVSVHATNLSEFWNGLLALTPLKAVTMKQNVDYGSIFTEHKVAPGLTAPEDNFELGPDTPSPTFTWEANGAGPSHRLNKFRVQFWNSEFTSMTFESEELDSPTYTPSGADWTAIFGGEDTVRWVVTGRNTDAPETGAYISSSRRIGRAKIAFVIDDTASMQEEIGAVREALTDLIIEFAARGVHVPIHLITFKDNVTSRILSSDLTAVQAEVNALFASGGDECPEASVDALRYAATTLNAGSVAFLATDADALPGSDIAAAVAELRASGIRVNVLLSGACSGGYKLADGQDLPPSVNCETCASKSYSKDGYPTAAIALYSVLAAETGGLYAFIPEVNSSPYFDPSGATRYENAAFNVMKAAVLPSLPALNPGFGYRGTTITISIDGSNTNFNATSTLTIGGAGVTVNSGGATSATHFVANVTVASGADLGFHNLTITTTLGKAVTEEATGTGTFEVKDTVTAPTVAGANPAQGTAGSALDVDIYGANTHFDATSTVNLGSGVTVNSVTVKSNSFLTARIAIDPTAAGYRDITVITSSNGETATENVPGPFLVTEIVNAVVPKLVSITPPVGRPGQTLNVDIVGENTHFVDGVSMGSFSDGGIVLLSTTVADLAHATVSLQIAADAAPGFRDVFITTGSEVAAILDAFEVGVRAPKASAGADQYVNTDTGFADVMLDGGGSEAYGTTISSYVWTGAPDPDDVATPALLGLPLGVYEFTLVVTDSEAHAGAPDTVTIFVKRPSDINGDQAFNAVDVQLVINAALGLDIGGLDADVDGNADVNAVDVQTVTNAALGVG